MIYACGSDAPSWLIQHVERLDGKQRSVDLAGALRGVGAELELREIKGKGMRGHAEINRRMGDPDYAGTNGG